MLDVTRPPHSFMRESAVSRSIVSNTPVTTNVSPAKQPGFPCANKIWSNKNHTYNVTLNGISVRGLLTCFLSFIRFKPLSPSLHNPPTYLVSLIYNLKQWSEFHICPSYGTILCTVHHLHTYIRTTCQKFTFSHVCVFACEHASLKEVKWPGHGTNHPIPI